jgi:hypothetical protein
MNKKAAEKIISVYWFAILFIVAAAIVYMVFSFYGEPYDVRELEANAMINQVAGCFSEGGNLKKEVLGENFNENFLASCNLNFEVEDFRDWKEQKQYYLEINFQTFPSEQNIFQIKEGNERLKEDCDLEGKTLPFCLERSFYVIDRTSTDKTSTDRYQVNILSIVRKTEKNVQ